MATNSIKAIEQPNINKQKILQDYCLYPHLSVILSWPLNMQIPFKEKRQECLLLG